MLFLLTVPMWFATRHHKRPITWNAGPSRNNCRRVTKKNTPESFWYLIQEDDGEEGGMTMSQMDTLRASALLSYPRAQWFFFLVDFSAPAALAGCSHLPFISSLFSAPPPPPSTSSACLPSLLAAVLFFTLAFVCFAFFLFSSTSSPPAPLSSSPVLLRLSTCSFLFRKLHHTTTHRTAARVLPRAATLRAIEPPTTCNQRAST